MDNGCPLQKLNQLNKEKMGLFEIGGIYTKREKFAKTYFIAISHKTLVTYKNGKFGKYTDKKMSYVSETDLSVGELCEFWNIDSKKMDDYMYEYFQPDDEAKERVNKEVLETIDLELLTLTGL